MIFSKELLSREIALKKMMRINLIENLKFNLYKCFIVLLFTFVTNYCKIAKMKITKTMKFIILTITTDFGNELTPDFLLNYFRNKIILSINCIN